MGPTTIDLAITLALQMLTRAGEIFGKVGIAHAGGAPITDADLDAAAALAGTSRAQLLADIAKAKAEGR